MATNPIIGRDRCHDCGKPIVVKAAKDGMGNCYYFCGNIDDEGDLCHAHARWGGKKSRQMKGAQARAKHDKMIKDVGNDNGISTNDNGPAGSNDNGPAGKTVNDNRPDERTEPEPEPKPKGFDGMDFIG